MGKHLPFWERVDKTESCWTWLGNRNNQNYGQVRINKKLLLAHRVAYELFKGQIPVGLILDHTCHNRDEFCLGGKNCLHRLCVNPEHLEAVTYSTNAKRGNTGGNLVQVNRAKETCPAGHSYDEVNTYHRPNSDDRGCRTCRREAHKRWRQRHGAVQYWF